MKINNLLNKINIHICRDKDPAYTFIQRKFIDNAFECSDIILATLIKKFNLKTFIQIGANDGSSPDDPLNQLIASNQLTGVLVEPQPIPANQLRRLYAGNSDITIVEAAVSTKAGKIKLWRFNNEAKVGRLKLDSVTSAHKSHLEKHKRISGTSALIEAFEVDALTLKDILSIGNLAAPDLFIIDTEGMDKVVLEQIEITETSPAIIQFEISNLRSHDLRECYNILFKKGYRFTLTNRDAICIHPNYIR